MPVSPAEACQILAEMAEHAAKGGETRERVLEGFARISKAGGSEDCWTPQRAETARRQAEAKFIGSANQ